MQTTKTIEQTTFSELNVGDIFTGVKPDGTSFLGMKVATREYPEDEPNTDVLVFNENKHPFLYNGGWIEGRPRVVKMMNLVFSKRPEKPSDLIIDIKNSPDPRGRMGAGCLYLVGNNGYLGVEVKFQSHAEQSFYVNVTTGECWHNAWVGTLDMRGNRAGKQFNLFNDGAALLRWQIVESDGEKRAMISYELPGGPATRAA